MDDYSPEIYLLSDDEYEGEDEQENIYYVCSRCGEILKEDCIFALLEELSLDYDERLFFQAIDVI